MKAIVVAAAVVAAVAIAAQLNRPEFHVHSSGVVLITGAGSGIGKAAAVDLARNTGFTVIAAVRKEQDMEGFKELGVERVVPMVLDVTNQTSIDDAYHKVKSMDLPMVALVNNAGVGDNRVVEDIDLNAARKVFDVNVFGVLAMTKTFLPLIREHHGRIVNIGSLAGVAARPMNAIYSGSKFAIEGISDSLRREVTHLGVSVSLVQPGVVKSQLVARSAAESQSMTLPQDLKEAYQIHIDRRKKQVVKSQANVAEPTVTSAAILHAITSPQPQVRYAVAGFGLIPGWFIANVVPVINGRFLDWVMSQV